MHRKILIAAAAFAALSVAACNKPAEETTIPDSGMAAEGSAEATATMGSDTGADTGGTAMSGGSGAMTTSPEGVTAADAGTSPTLNSDAPTVDTTKGPATATTPTAKVPLETERKNNPPPSQ